MTLGRGASRGSSSSSTWRRDSPASRRRSAATGKLSSRERRAFCRRTRTDGLRRCGLCSSRRNDAAPWVSPDADASKSCTTRSRSGSVSPDSTSRSSDFLLRRRKYFRPWEVCRDTLRTPLYCRLAQGRCVPRLETRVTAREKASHQPGVDADGRLDLGEFDSFLRPMRVADRAGTEEDRLAPRRKKRQVAGEGDDFSRLPLRTPERNGIGSVPDRELHSALRDRTDVREQRLDRLPRPEDHLGACALRDDV